MTPFSFFHHIPDSTAASFHRNVKSDNVGLTAVPPDHAERTA